MIQVKADTRQVTLTLQEQGRRAKSVLSKGSPVPGQIWKEMQIRVDSVFQANRKGGTHRGATWSFFKDQYVRKTDGVVVPAWGGVPKIRGHGSVLSKKRPSGTRVTASSSIMQDTGELRRGAASVLHVGHNRMVIGTDARVGARASALSKHHPFLFWFLPSDLEMARRHVADYLEGGGNAGA